MTTALTSGIQISVNCKYEDRFSNPETPLFLFSYEIEIKNGNTYPIQLLSRRWYIIDSNTQKREIEGEGVIGVKPLILPNETYTYRSTCDFSTDTGKMCGTYKMKNTSNNQTFVVAIPEFMLMVPYKLN